MQLTSHLFVFTLFFLLRTAHALPYLVVNVDGETDSGSGSNAGADPVTIIETVTESADPQTPVTIIRTVTPSDYVITTIKSQSIAAASTSNPASSSEQTSQSIQTSLIQTSLAPAASLSPLPTTLPTAADIATAVNSNLKVTTLTLTATNIIYDLPPLITVASSATEQTTVPQPTHTFDDGKWHTYYVDKDPARGGTHKSRVKFYDTGMYTSAADSSINSTATVTTSASSSPSASASRPVVTVFPKYEPTFIPYSNATTQAKRR